MRNDTPFGPSFKIRNTAREKTGQPVPYEKRNLWAFCLNLVMLTSIMSDEEGISRPLQNNNSIDRIHQIPFALSELEDIVEQSQV